jgi:hypothetical protein
MSRGLGKIERDCVRVITEYRAAGRWPNTYNITAEVYQIERDEKGNRSVSNAQHSAVKRALLSLRRKELIRAVQVCQRNQDDPRLRHYALPD